MKKAIIAFTIIVIGFTLSACGSNYEYVEGKVNIVATTTMLGDLAKELGGDNVSVTTLMGVGVDPHLYSAKASDTNALLKSDMIVYGGLHLEGKMVDILEELSDDKAYINSGEVLENDQGTILYDDNQTADPHIWFNVENWIIVAKAFTKELIEIDPDNENDYTSLGNAYVKELEALNTWIKDEVQTLSEDKRILVTAHDAFRYFADAYDFEVHAIQGISTDSEASISDINTLVDLVTTLGVKSIFIESSVPQKTIDSVIESAKNEGYDLSIGGELYSDSLGDGIYSSYIEAVKHNVETIVEALK